MFSAYLFLKFDRVFDGKRDIQELIRMVPY